MKLSRWDGVSLISIAAAVAITASVYDRLPDPLPTHFDLAGNPNGWMPLPVGAWGIPGFALALWIFIRFIARILPMSDRKRITEHSQSLVAMLTAVFIAAVHVVVLYVAITPGGVSVTKLVFCLMGIFFVALGLVLPRIRRNPIIGVRTPWTLTSDENWARTHRFTGYTMVIGGILGGVVGTFGSGTSGGVFAILCFMLAGLIPAAYSLIIARRADPQ